MKFEFNDWITVINDNFIESPTDFYDNKCPICKSFYHKTNNRQTSCLNHYFVFKCCTCRKEYIIDNKHKGEYFSKYKNEKFFCSNKGNAKYTCKDRFNIQNKLIFSNDSIKVFGYRLDDLTKVELTCQKCGNIKIIDFGIDYRRINPILQGKDYICINCVRINNGKLTGGNNISKYNKSDKHKEIAAKNLSNLLKSEDGLKWLDSHNKSEIMREQARKLGKKCGIINLKLLISYDRDENGRIISVQKLGKDKISFEEYCKRFLINENIDKIIQDYGFIDIKFDCSLKYKNYPTLAYQQYLNDLFKDTPWLVHIKYFIDSDNKSRPLVVGKTGVLEVNYSGVDIAFDIKDNDNRAARQFLINNNYKWDKDKISIIGFKTENEAFKFESKILKELELFGS